MIFSERAPADLGILNGIDLERWNLPPTIPVCQLWLKKPIRSPPE
jgi:hypothetical protein